jgi:hypothetical protein
MLKLEGKGTVPVAASTDATKEVMTMIQKLESKLDNTLCQLSERRPMDDAGPNRPSYVQREAPGRNVRDGRGRLVCHGCGFSGHILRECRLKDVTCFQCGGKGHVRSRCQNPPRDVPMSRPGNTGQSQ